MTECNEVSHTNVESVLITGASSGIGEACAIAFATQGANLLLHGRNEDKLKTLCIELEQTYQISADYVLGDLSQLSDVKPIVQKAQKLFNGVDALVHCAGTLHQSGLAFIRNEDIQQQLNLHLGASLTLAQLCSRLMIRRKSGSMLFVSSIVANQGAAGQALYSMAKSGISGLIKSLAKELGPQGIRVNGIAPGFINTPLVKDYSEEQKQELANRTCLKALGEAKQVADVVTFLSSQSAGYITGEIIAVDGGLSLP